MGDHHDQNGRLSPSGLAERNRRTALGVFAVVLLMVGLSFAAVPLYDMFCRVTGWGGTTQVADRAPGEVRARTVTVKFNTDVDPGLPWDFEAEQREVTVNVGADALINFRARNKTARPTAGTALYNVSPPKVGKYFNKTQCFCFAYQPLEPRQSANMPVVFFIDPAFDDDPNMDDVSVITLSYTYYPADSKALEQAQEDYAGTR